MQLKSITITSLFAAAAVSADIHVFAPPPRDTSQIVENQKKGPCGKGFENAGLRTTVPLSGFDLHVQGDMKYPKWTTISVTGALGDNPTEFPNENKLAQFSESLTSLKVPIDFSKISAKAGDKVTLQIIESKVMGYKYACVDLLLVDPSASSSNATFETATLDGFSSTGTATSTGSSATNSGYATSNAASTTSNAASTTSNAASTTSNAASTTSNAASTTSISEFTNSGYATSNAAATTSIAEFTYSGYATSNAEFTYATSADPSSTSNAPILANAAPSVAESISSLIAASVLLYCF